MVLRKLLKTYSKTWSDDIAGVYYDPFRECSESTSSYNDIAYRVMPFMFSTKFSGQLCTPDEYFDHLSEKDDIMLFSLVAWDHVSWPGNDFWAGNRATDDGVKAAATDSMAKITGVSGTYNEKKFKYNPPDPYRTWGDVAKETNCHLEVINPFIV